MEVSLVTEMRSKMQQLVDADSDTLKDELVEEVNKLYDLVVDTEDALELVKFRYDWTPYTFKVTPMQRQKLDRIFYQNVTVAQ